MANQRLDVLLVERGLCATREQAQTSILAGEVWSGEQRLEKAGVRVSSDTPLEIRARTTPFASRAGQKIQFGLDRFGLDVTGLVCLDIGASTGGFTDCLLQRGARHVFAVDVGYGQLDRKLREDARVTVVEKTNARYLSRAGLLERSPLAAEVTFLCSDVSFISLAKIVEPVAHEFPGIRHWLLLFKPQFEVGQKFIGKGGVVKDVNAVGLALDRFHAFAATLGLALRGGPESSPLTGKKSGNVEYLLHYERTDVPSHP